MTTNLTIDINWKPDHYVSRFWIDKSDPYVSELPFLPVGMPIYWGILVLLLGVGIKWIGPFYMAYREPIDVRPVTLILDGLAFGGYVTGLLGVVVPTGFFMDCFDCSAYSPSTERYDHLVVKHFAYGIIFAKLFDFMVPLFFCLAKKPPVTNIYMGNLMAMSLGTVSLVKINPGGIFVFAAVIDGLHSVVFYSYLTFTAADPMFRPSRRWKACLFFSKMLAWSLILAHSAYFLSVPNCGEAVIKLAMMVFSIMVLVLFPYDFYQMDQAATDRLARKDLQRAIRRASRLSVSGKIMMPPSSSINSNKFMSISEASTAAEQTETKKRKDKEGTDVPGKESAAAVSRRGSQHPSLPVRHVSREECKPQ